MESLQFRFIRRMRGCSKQVSLAAVLLLLSACAGQEVTVEQVRAATSLRSKWCMVGNTRIHYLDMERATAGTSLLILHGYLGSTVSFLDLIDRLSPDLRVVMPDLPAFGASGVPDCAHTMEYYLDFLAGFTEAVGLDRYYLMGTSMGANMAAHYAAKYPRAVRGLIFSSPFGLHDQAGRMSRIKRWDTFLPLFCSLITRGGIQRRLRRSILNDERITPELVDAYWKPFTTAEGRRATVEFTREILGRCSMDEVLPQIEQSVLILIGSEDKLLDADDYEKFHRLLAREQLEIIGESGHFVYLDAPEVVTKKIVTFTRGGKE